MTTPTTYIKKLGQSENASAARTNLGLGSMATENISSGTHVTSWGGAWTTSQQGNISWTKQGRWVTLRFPTVSSDTQDSSTLNATTVLPSSLLPAYSEISTNIIIIDDSAIISGAININAATGGISIGPMLDPVTGVPTTFAHNPMFPVEVGIVASSISYLSAN